MHTSSLIQFAATPTHTPKYKDTFFSGPAPVVPRGSLMWVGIPGIPPSRAQLSVSVRLALERIEYMKASEEYAEIVARISDSERRVLEKIEAYETENENKIKEEVKEEM